MKLSKDATARLLAQAADAALPYRTLAAAIATANATVAAKAEATKAERKSLWALFRDSLALGLEAQHTATDLRVGLEVALADAVPGGSFRSYIGTVGNMYADIVAGSLSVEDASTMTVEKARERYPADPAKAARKRVEAALIAALKSKPDDYLETLTAGILEQVEADKAKTESEEGEERQVA